MTRPDFNTHWRSPRKVRRSAASSITIVVAAEILESRVLLTAYSLNTVANFVPFPQGEAPKSQLVADIHGNIYGTTTFGGAYGYGTIFEISASTKNLTTLASLPIGTSQSSGSGVALDARGDLFGTIYNGGATQQGSVYELPVGASSITTIASFTSTTTTGIYPNGAVTLDPTGDIFGDTISGGLNGKGTIFEIAAASSSITVLAPFTAASGGGSSSNLTLDSVGDLFGTTKSGGVNSDGAIFEVASGSSSVSVVASFNGTNGKYPLAGLTPDSAGNLYGDTSQGGLYGYGATFKLAVGSTSITSVVSLIASNGISPEGQLAVDAKGDLYGTAESGGNVEESGSIFEVPSGSTTAVTFVASSNNSISNPVSGLLIDSSGNLYGTAATEGAESDGVVYEINSELATKRTDFVYSFSSAQGSNPEGGVVLDSQGNLLGDTESGGVGYNQGTVFKIASGGSSISTLASFYDSEEPTAGITLDPVGNIYGAGGPLSGLNLDGGIFQVTPSGTYNQFASFASNSLGRPEGGLVADASGNLYGTTTSQAGIFEIAAGSSSITVLAQFNEYNPYPAASLILDAKGDLFGTTEYGGASSDGEIFELTSGSTSITTLAVFGSTTGVYPTASLTLDASGDLFGTTSRGGTGNDGTVFELASGSSSVTTLVTFTGANGDAPGSGLTRDSSGDLFGTTEYGGGTNGFGTVYEIASGTTTIQTLVTFSSSTGHAPIGNLSIDASGNLYGTTISGGAARAGTVFELSPIAPPAPTLNNPVAGATTVNNTPIFSGTGGIRTIDSPTVTVNIYSGTVAIGTPVQTLTAMVNGSTGAFSVTPSTALPVGTYTAQAVQTDSVSDTGVSAVDTFTIIAAPDISSFTVGNGTPQRSMVKTLTLTFTEPVTLDSGAISLTRTSGGTSTAITYTAVTADGGTTYVITPTSGTSGGSLTDGNYSLIVHPSGVHAVSNPSSIMTGSDQTYTFFRLFGDSNGDGTVNLIDYRAFANAYLKSAGVAGYNAAFDFNGDGTINLIDYRAFTANYLRTITN